MVREREYIPPHQRPAHPDLIWVMGSDFFALGGEVSRGFLREDCDGSSGRCVERGRV